MRTRRMVVVNMMMVASAQMTILPESLANCGSGDSFDR